ncbi:MAG: hypothetical protein ACREQQ_10380 [Candidatus Binatia bacterium]
MKRARRRNGNGTGLPHRLFGQAFYENLASLMDREIAGLMKDPAFRRMLQEFNLRMFRLMAELAEKQMSGGK